MANRREPRENDCFHTVCPYENPNTLIRQYGISSYQVQQAQHGPSPAARPSVRGRPLPTARRDATTTRRDRARCDRASNGARATRREDANDRRATSRDVARDDIRMRDSIRIWIGCDAMRSDATRFGEREDDDATRTDESTTRE